MKIAMCFIISYKHILNKEHIWIDWIEDNKDIINVYFHYTNFSLIKSEWIKKHALPPHFLMKTDYLHIVPAYLSLMYYATTHDPANKWFCFLTEACCPIISPLKFRSLFMEKHDFSIMGWKRAWWNVHFTKRANLNRLHPEFHLANTPWFILKKQHVDKIIQYSNINNHIYKLVCNGNIANESIFAIILHSFNLLNDSEVINEESMITNWEQMSSSTSPYSFKFGNSYELAFINNSINKNKYSMFVRKVDASFPDKVIYKYTIIHRERERSNS
jgi:hypothetical protein